MDESVAEGRYTETLLYFLRQGGLVYAKRRSGKTHALIQLAIELLAQEERVVLAGCQPDVRPTYLMGYYFELGGDGKYIRNHQLGFAGSLEHYQGMKQHAKLLVDEYPFTWVAQHAVPFFAATATVKYPVQVVNRAMTAHELAVLEALQ